MAQGAENSGRGVGHQGAEGFQGPHPPPPTMPLQPRTGGQSGGFERGALRGQNPLQSLTRIVPPRGEEMDRRCARVWMVGAGGDTRRDSELPVREEVIPRRMRHDPRTLAPNVAI